MFAFLMEHEFWVTLVAYWMFSAAVSSLPDPAPAGGPGYLWLFRFAHTMAGNVTTAFGSRILGLRLLAVVLILPLALFPYACAAVQYQVHPGALNATDSTAYDVLLIAGATIDQARMDLESGELPEETRDALNKLVAVYNLTRESWLTYRSALMTNAPAQAYLDQLNQNLSALKEAMKVFEEDR